MKRKGIVRIVLGAILVVLQILSVAGNAKIGISTQLSFASIGALIYSLIVLTSYYFVGIVGLILLISGAIASRKVKQQQPAIEEPIVSKDEEMFTGFSIPLSTIMPVLIAIFVVLLAIVIILDRS